jgi:hypothetical protein
MTIQEVIAKTSKIKERKIVKGNTNGRFIYLKKYNDCTAILFDKNKVNEYYVLELFDVYGKFPTLKKAIQFRHVLHLHTEAHKQAMHNSWKEEGAGFCTVQNANL